MPEAIFDADRPHVRQARLWRALDQFFDLWYAGLDTAQVAVRRGITEGEAYNATANSWEWDPIRKKKAAPLLARPKGD